MMVTRKRILRSFTRRCDGIVELVMCGVLLSSEMLIARSFDRLRVLWCFSGNRGYLY